MQKMALINGNGNCDKDNGLQTQTSSQGTHRRSRGNSIVYGLKYKRQYSALGKSNDSLSAVSTNLKVESAISGFSEESVDDCDVHCESSQNHMHNGINCESNSIHTGTLDHGGHQNCNHNHLETYCNHRLTEHNHSHTQCTHDHHDLPIPPSSASIPYFSILSACLSHKSPAKFASFFAFFLAVNLYFQNSESLSTIFFAFTLFYSASLVATSHMAYTIDSKRIRFDEASFPFGLDRILYICDGFCLTGYVFCLMEGIKEGIEHFAYGEHDEVGNPVWLTMILIASSYIVDVVAHRYVTAEHRIGRLRVTLFLSVFMCMFVQVFKLMEHPLECYIDFLFCILHSVAALYSVTPRIEKLFAIFLCESLTEHKEKAILLEQSICKFSEVVSLNELRIWTLDRKRDALKVVISVSAETHISEFRIRFLKFLRSKVGASSHISLEIHQSH